MLESLRSSGEKTLFLLQSTPEEKGVHRYEPGKWSLKESLCHVMDVERIFSYRALRFARHDQTPLHGFDDNNYVLEANANVRNMKELIDEMVNLRKTTIDLFRSFTPTMLQREGIASENKLSVLSIGYIIAGHECHHYKILTEKYLSK